jgi:hypothetical protein
MLTRENVDSVISQLHQQIFVSEAHLQLSFALLIDQNQFDVFPEFPAFVDGVQSEFDLLIKDKNTGTYSLVEFKYKTANNSKNPEYFELVSGQSIALKNHSAIDLGWYDSWKDISRIEKCVSGSSYVKGKKGKISISNGFFILITNDKGYWEKSKENSEQAVDGLFMNAGNHEAGARKFKEKKDYRGSRNNEFKIENDYEFDYQPYRMLPGKYGDFRILIVEIPPLKMTTIPAP